MQHCETRKTAHTEDILCLKSRNFAHEKSCSDQQGSVTLSMKSPGSHYSTNLPDRVIL